VGVAGDEIDSGGGEVDFVGIGGRIDISKRDVFPPFLGGFGVVDPGTS